jgi:aminopeptidase N
MEYPMSTLITGERNLGSLVGVSVHELMHSWYQMILGTNESLYAWMDEGFTSYASALVMNHLRKEGKLPGEARDNPFLRTYIGFAGFAKSGMEEPLSTHSDHFTTNAAYGVGSYTKGSIFLNQLSYIIGEETFAKGMLSYFDEWKFKHPNDNDFIRVMEKESGLELDWYREYWVNTTHTIDYGINDVVDYDEGKAVLNLQKIGVMQMPLDVVVEM